MISTHRLRSGQDNGQCYRSHAEVRCKKDAMYACTPLVWTINPLAGGTVSSIRGRNAAGFTRDSHGRRSFLAPPAAR